MIMISKNIFSRHKFTQYVFVLVCLFFSLSFGGCGIFGLSNSNYVGPGPAKTAKKYVGIPYVYGGTTPSGFDCSGLTSYVYKKHGVNLPRTSHKQAEVGRFVRKPHLRVGDLVFFKTGKTSKVSHVGIYIGQDKFVHAPGRGKKVTIATLSNKYFQKTYHSARRMARNG